MINIVNIIVLNLIGWSCVLISYLLAKYLKNDIFQTIKDIVIFSFPISIFFMTSGDLFLNIFYSITQINTEDK
jgi:hypothetical protein